MSDNNKEVDWSAEVAIELKNMIEKLEKDLQDHRNTQQFNLRIIIDRSINNRKVLRELKRDMVSPILYQLWNLGVFNGEVYEKIYDKGLKIETKLDTPKKTEKKEFKLIIEKCKTCEYYNKDCSMIEDWICSYKQKDSKKEYIDPDMEQLKKDGHFLLGSGGEKVDKVVGIGGASPTRNEECNIPTLPIKSDDSKPSEPKCDECGGHLFSGYLLHTGSCSHLYDKQEPRENECHHVYTSQYPYWECGKCGHHKFDESGSEHAVESVDGVGGSSPSPDYHQIHELKTIPRYFQPLLERIKTFEIRLNDQDFKIGDTLVLKEYSYEIKNDLIVGYTGREIAVEVLYILRAEGSFFSFLDDYVIMGIKF